MRREMTTLLAVASAAVLSFLLGASKTAWADYSYDGTADDDTIYFGYCDACTDGSPCLLICHQGKDRVEVSLDTGGVLEIDGRGGSDYIQAAHGTEKAGCKFGDFLRLPYSDIRILGGGADDCLVGTAGDQHLIGGSGDDYLAGASGNDVLSGGPGNDFLIGDQGNDDLYGQCGNDVLVGATGDDLVVGGLGTDTFRCRGVVTPTRYDGSRYGEDCGDTRGRRGIERTQRHDPYREWAYITRCRNGVTHHHQTTSDAYLLLADRAEGASILLDSSGQPRAVTHKQYGGVCGPASLNIVMEHLGIADSRRPVYGLRDLDGAGTTVDLGYQLSIEHIMYECYRRYRQRDPVWASDRPAFMDSETGELKTHLSGDATHFEIPYDLGGSTRTGRIESWLRYGPACGYAGTGILNRGLPWVANRYARDDFADAYPVTLRFATNGRRFGSLEHLEAVIAGYIDHDIPLTVGVESGGHFNTLIGYWQREDGFWIYLADPLDGWGRPFYGKPMRWRKVLLNDEALPTGAELLVGVMLYGHTCADGGWDSQIDQLYSRPLLCGS